MGTRFQIYLDLLAAPNQVHTRSYKDDYFIVLTPSAEVQADSIRHAYLHYQVDPLSLRYAQELEKKRGLIDYAQGVAAARGLLQGRLRAADDRVPDQGDREPPGACRRTPGAGDAGAQRRLHRDARLRRIARRHTRSRSSRCGSIIRQLIKEIDLKRETARLDQVKFLSERPVTKQSRPRWSGRSKLSGVARTLEEAEQLYTARDLDKAKAQYLSVLKETGEKPAQAKAYYGLARVAALQNDPESAVQVLRKDVAVFDRTRRRWPGRTCTSVVWRTHPASASRQPRTTTRRWTSRKSPRQREKPPRRASKGIYAMILARRSNGMKKAYSGRRPGGDCRVGSDGAQEPAAAAKHSGASRQRKSRKTPGGV